MLTVSQIRDARPADQPRKHFDSRDPLRVGEFIESI